MVNNIVLIDTHQQYNANRRRLKAAPLPGQGSHLALAAHLAHCHDGPLANDVRAILRHPRRPFILRVALDPVPIPARDAGGCEPPHCNGADSEDHAADAHAADPAGETGRTAIWRPSLSKVNAACLCRHRKTSSDLPALWAGRAFGTVRHELRRCSIDRAAVQLICGPSDDSGSSSSLTCFDPGKRPRSSSSLNEAALSPPGGQSFFTLFCDTSDRSLLRMRSMAKEKPKPDPAPAGPKPSGAKPKPKPKPRPGPIRYTDWASI